MATTDVDLPDFDHLWDYNDPSLTECTFRGFLPAARTAGNASYLVELLTQIARTEGLQRHFDDAHRTLDEAQALLPAAGDRAKIRYLLERGRAFNSAQRGAEAREYFLQAFQLAQDQAEDFYAVDAAHMMGIIEPPERQLEWNLRAVESADTSTDSRARGWLGSLYNNLGWTYHELGRYQDALAMFQRGLEWQQQASKPREIRIAYWAVARALRSLGRYEEALQRQQENLRHIQGTGDPDGYIQEEMGECLLALGREEDAREHCARAWAVLSQDPWLQERESERLERLARLGQVQLRQQGL